MRQERAIVDGSLDGLAVGSNSRLVNSLEGRAVGVFHLRRAALRVPLDLKQRVITELHGRGVADLDGFSIAASRAQIEGDLTVVGERLAADGALDAVLEGGDLTVTRKRARPSLFRAGSLERSNRFIGAGESHGSNRECVPDGCGNRAPENQLHNIAARHSVARKILSQAINPMFHG
jgi:hypothetical protein